MRQSVGDYWRFTPKAIELLLKRFGVYEVEFDGDPAFPEGVYGFGIKGRGRKNNLNNFPLNLIRWVREILTSPSLQIPFHLLGG